MKDHISTLGIILKTSNLGEYDKRVVFLTENYGKITVFARGVRRQNSKYLAACTPFCFGELRAFPGKDAYTMLDFVPSNYFVKLRLDYKITCIGTYFLEIADYYTRENNDDILMLKLLYVALLMLEKVEEGTCRISLDLLKIIFELKSISVNGEFPGILPQIEISDDAKYAINYIDRTPIENVFSFDVSSQVLDEMKMAAEKYCSRFLNGRFKSLEILESLG